MPDTKFGYVGTFHIEGHIVWDVPGIIPGCPYRFTPVFAWYAYGLCDSILLHTHREHRRLDMLLSASGPVSFVVKFQISCRMYYWHPQEAFVRHDRTSCASTK